MPASSAVSQKNSTTVRLAEWLAPQLVLNRAFEAWCTPPRPKKLRAPVDARPFEIDTPLGALKAWEWGMRDDAETVLLVHGWGGSAVTMEKLARPLAEGGRKVVAIDLPAHGQSPGEQTNLVEIMRAAEAAMWRLRPDAVIAHSLGASGTALALEHAPHVRRLVLLAPGENPSYFARAFTTRVGLSDEIAAGLLARIEQRVGVHPDTLQLRLHAPPAMTQTLLVHDPADEEVPWEHAQAIAAFWHDTELVAAPGTGHYRLPRHAGVMQAAVDFVLEGKVPEKTIRVLEAKAA